MENKTDSLFFTKYSHNEPSLSQIKKFSESLGRPNKSRLGSIDQMYNDYNLFKYSKCFASTKKGNSLKSVLKVDDKIGSLNSKSIQRESQKLKERLTILENERKALLEKLRTARY